MIRLDFEWTKVHQKWQKHWFNLAIFKRNPFCGKINFAENHFYEKINFAENQFQWKSTSRKNQFHGKSISRKNQFQENINFAEKSISRKNQDCFRETLIVFSVAICFHDFFAKIIQIFIKLIFTRNWWSVKVNFREIEIQCLPFLQNRFQ